jgi:hypothetical protein
MERDLFIRLAMCADPRKMEVAGLSKRAMRSMGIGAENLDPKEQRHREGLKRKILRQITPYHADETVLPGFGPHAGFPGVQQFRIEIPPENVFEVSKKIVRGCEYILGDGRIGDPPYELTVRMAGESEIPDVVGMFAKFAVFIPSGPGDLGQRRSRGVERKFVDNLRNARDNLRDSIEGEDQRFGV